MRPLPQLPPLPPLLPLLLLPLLRRLARRLPPPRRRALVSALAPDAAALPTPA